MPDLALPNLGRPKRESGGRGTGGVIDLSKDSQAAFSDGSLETIHRFLWPMMAACCGAPHLDPSAYAKKFSGKYAHRNINGGIGHNLPQETPQAFAQAVIDATEI